MRAAHLRRCYQPGFFGWLRTVVDEGTAITETEMRAAPDVSGGAEGISRPLVPDDRGAAQRRDHSLRLLSGDARRHRRHEDAADRQRPVRGRHDRRDAHPPPGADRLRARVLHAGAQGHRDSMTFPDGTPGGNRRFRASLWQAGLDYLHGTGHGVGAALNVHEGRSISTRYHNAGAQGGDGGLERAGLLRHRRRLRHPDRELLVIGPKATAHSFNGREYLGFDPLTMVPIQQSLIQPSLLTDVKRRGSIRITRACGLGLAADGGGLRGLSVAQGAHTALDRKGAAAAAAAPASRRRRE